MISMIANGYLRLDPQEWVRAVENVARRWDGKTPELPTNCPTTS
jgi:hypothetical protein